MNDWPIKKFLVFVVTIQLALWGAIGSEALGLQIPILRQIVALVYLLCLPGVIILRTLKLHKLGSIEVFLYSVGLSIATIMFTGVFVNVVFPPFGISAPVSTIPLMISFNVLIMVLSVIAYKRDSDFSPTTNVNIKRLFTPPVLFLNLLPLIGILGMQLVNHFQNNIILIGLIALIATTVLFIGFKKFIPKNQYTLAIFAMSLSMLFYHSLIGPYISGIDIHEEYYVANLVKTSNVWDPTIPMMLNSMLSVTMLAPILSILIDQNLTLVFKVVYPLLFAVVPLGMYQIFRKQSDGKIAFFACFYFIAFHIFYDGLAVILRQQVATLYFVLLILLMVTRTAPFAAKRFLFIVFGASLIVSHYGLSYIYLGYLVLAWLVLLVVGNPRIRNLWDCLHHKIDARQNTIRYPKYPSRCASASTINLASIGLLSVLVLTWYLSTSGSQVFVNLVTIGTRITNNFYIDILDAEVSPVLRILTVDPLPGLLFKIGSVFFLNRILTVLGVLDMIWGSRKHKFGREYVIFAFISLVILALIVFIPSSFDDVDRLYHITMIILAPAVVLGALTVHSLVRSFILALKVKKPLKWAIPVFAMLSVYLVVFFFYQTGFIWQLTQGHSGSYMLSQTWIEKNASAEIIAAMRGSVTPAHDVLGAEWLSTNTFASRKIYTTYRGTQVQPLTSYGMIYDGIEPHKYILPLTPEAGIEEGAYIYLQYLNLVDGIGTTWDLKSRTYGTFDYKQLFPLLNAKNKMYSNGGSEIYK